MPTLESHRFPIYSPPRLHGCTNKVVHPWDRVIGGELPICTTRELRQFQHITNCQHILGGFKGQNQIRMRHPVDVRSNELETLPNCGG
jgi:hypothetical protein